MKVKALLKMAGACIASVAAFVLTYCGALVLLGQFMYDDWRILFIALLPAFIVAGIVEGAFER